MKKRESIHAKCLAVGETPEGREVICRRSKGHTSSFTPDRRLHWDLDAEHFWAEPGDGPAQDAAALAGDQQKVAADFDRALGKLLKDERG
jgi:hypothetical protein